MDLRQVGEIFFYANGKCTAHRGVLLEDGETARVRVTEPTKFYGTVFEVPRSDVRVVRERRGLRVGEDA